MSLKDSLHNLPFENVVHDTFEQAAPGRQFTVEQKYNLLCAALDERPLKTRQGVIESLQDVIEEDIRQW